MRNFLLATTVVAALGVAGMGAAQSDTPFYPSNITLRAGAVIPADSSFSDVSNVLGNLGLDYRLDKPLIGSGESYFALDYFFRAFGGDGGSGSAVPFTINQRFYTSSNEYRSYFFVGVGAVYMTSDRGNGTAVALRGGVGQELGNRITAEIAAYLSDKAGGNRANSVAFNIGYRF